MFDKLSPRALVILAQSHHRVAFFAVRVRAAIKNALAHVHHRKRSRVFFHVLTSQGQQAANVITVIVRENDLLDIAQVDIQLACVRQHGFWTSSRIHKNPMSVALDQSGEAPLPNTPIRQHGRKDGHLESLDLSVCRDVFGLCKGERGSEDDSQSQRTTNAVLRHSRALYRSSRAQLGFSPSRSRRRTTSRIFTCVCAGVPRASTTATLSDSRFAIA